jgi:hypothetical protein
MVLIDTKMQDLRAGLAQIQFPLGRDSVYAFDPVVNLWLEVALICYCQPGKNYPGYLPLEEHQQGLKTANHHQQSCFI